MLAVAAFLAPAGLATLTASAVAPSKAKKADFWRPFEPAQIPALVAGGKTVFVDVTADWCLTCQLNKTLVLTKGEVMKRLTAGDVVPMQADWTRPNDAIARYLAEFQRYGIPFNAVYGPGAPQGLPLSEVLTPGEVLDALDKAKSKATAAFNK
jgi:suppressor for copper-sensitivity B